MKDYRCDGCIFLGECKESPDNCKGFYPEYEDVKKVIVCKTKV